MNILRYLTGDEQLLVKDAKVVQVSAALLKAAQVRVDELQNQAIEKVGSVDDKVIVQLLMEAKGLKWILDLPENIKKLINSSEQQ